MTSLYTIYHIQEKLDKIGLTGYPKTTGGDGMHIYIPIEVGYTYEQARKFAEVLGMIVNQERPELFTTPRSVATPINWATSWPASP